MKRVLFFDTETTGKIDWKAPNGAKHQPRIVQLGAILCLGPTEPVARIEAIVKPDGWAIPDDAAAIHGITTEIAMEKGFPIADVLHLFHTLCVMSDELVAYNADFDMRMLAIEADRTMVLEPWRKLPVVDPMHICTSICQLPGQYGDYKWPKLAEAFEKVVGRPWVQNHTALDDVRALATLYFKLRDDDLLPKPAPDDANEASAAIP